jgi:ATP-dependent DNA helicase PIF1
MAEQLNTNDVQLTTAQNEAYSFMAQGQSVFLTGPAGVGKSLLIKMFRRVYCGQKNIAITSTTGISAILLGGTTLHSYLGIGLGTGSVGALTTKILKKPYLRKRWKQLEVLIIDEISMLDPILFDKLEAIARAVRYDSRPFGGIQLILSGDFCQLPVVGSDDFCFEAKTWDDCVNHTIHLTEILRQTDNEFQTCLNEMRMGKMSSASKRLIKSCYNKELTNEFGIKPTKIFPTNGEVDYMNEQELDLLAEDGREFNQYDMKLDV